MLNVLNVKVRLNEKHSEESARRVRVTRQLEVGAEPTVVRAYVRRFVSWMKTTGRREVVGEVVKMNRRTFHVKLPDGRVVKRKLARDLVD